MSTDRVRDLARRLEVYRASDALEAEHLARMRTLCCEELAFSRASYAPGHFTASAFILSPDRSELLLIFHAKLGRWLQPGGHVEGDDRTLLDAARREVREEVGIRDLDLTLEHPLDLDVHAIPARKSEPSHEHFDVRFLFRARDRAFQAGSDAKEARWFRLEAIGLETSDRSVMRAVEKLGPCSG